MVFPILPPEASETAARVDELFGYLIAVCGLFLAGIAGVMTYWLIKYRRGRPAYRKQRKISTTPFEVTWSVIPLMFFLSFFVWGANLYFRMESPPADSLEIHVIGKQWMWKLQHLEGNREIDELHVPVGRDVKLVMATEDVIHSFYLPAFRVKQDVVPGRYTTLWFHANRIGNFPIYCAEYCGADHSFMVGRIIVMTPKDYESWLARERPESSLVAQGAHLFRELGCSGCHMGNSVVDAPPLEGLYGKPVPLQNGQVVTADDKYIHDSILYPNLQIAAGHKAVMPSFEGQVTEEQVFKLVTYIKSLANKTPEPRHPGGKKLSSNRPSVGFAAGAVEITEAAASGSLSPGERVRVRGRRAGELESGLNFCERRSPSPRPSPSGRGSIVSSLTNHPAAGLAARASEKIGGQT